MFLSSADLKKNLSRIPSKCQTVLIQISPDKRPDVLSGPDRDLICLQRLSADDTSRQRVDKTEPPLVKMVLLCDQVTLPIQWFYM